METLGIEIALGVGKEINMRNSMFVAALVLVVPSVALADEPPLHSEVPALNLTQPTYQSPLARPATTPSSVESAVYVEPHYVPYHGGTIPSYTHIETKPDGGLIGGGLGILGGTYVISLIYALSTCGAQMDCRTGSQWLYMPVVGPFITAAEAPTTGGAALAIFDGGVQVLGAALAIAGFVAPKKFVVWQDKTAKLSVNPTTASSQGVSAGLGLTLTTL